MLLTLAPRICAVCDFDSSGSTPAWQEELSAEQDGGAAKTDEFGILASRPQISGNRPVH
jgi:hypothetical protein